MNGITWLIYANIVVWIGLSAYVFFIACKQTKMGRQLNELEGVNHDD